MEPAHTDNFGGINDGNVVGSLALLDMASGLKNTEDQLLVIVRQLVAQL